MSSYTDWLYYALNHLKLNQYATGQAQPGLSVNILEKTQVVLPTPPEQQKIADCPTSLDNLISAQAQKLGALKTHKKGMMQQLFPAANKKI